MTPDALGVVRARVEVLRPPIVVLIDGGAGAGKTTLAQQLVARWPFAEDAQLVSLDDLYPGWNGLAAGASAVSELIRTGSYQSWDWTLDEPGPWRQLDPSRSMVIEGCGAITPSNAELADLTIWLELDATLRRQRALARDGEMFAGHWQEWAAQEEQHWLRDHPAEIADLVLPEPTRWGTIEPG